MRLGCRFGRGKTVAVLFQLLAEQRFQFLCGRAGGGRNGKRLAVAWWYTLNEECDDGVLAQHGR